MQQLMPILFFATLAGILVNSIVVRYSTLTSPRLTVLLIIFLGSIPLVVISLVVVLSAEWAGSTDMWALGTLAAVIGFWLKTPFRNARD